MSRERSGKPPRTRPGAPYPLGATWDGAGVNFALFSEHATAVDLCLFDPEDPSAELHRIRMQEHTNQVWHVYLPEARPGLPYGYRVHGPYEPAHGHRFNPAKLLLDPYAKAITGSLQWHDALFGYQLGNPDQDLAADDRDSAPYVPKSVAIDPAFSWGEDRRPRTPWHKTIIYELHVKGFTARHPDVPRPLRGTYAGLASPPVLDYLSRLGVTAVELLPVHYSVTDGYLADRGLTNYWGYNSIGFLAPDSRLAAAHSAGEQVAEFKTMVKTLHEAGIEVILDVVYNHTAEGNHLGPTLSFRGIDNAAYYRLVSDSPRYCMDYTGCGNTLNMTHPRTLQLIMDSLRSWVLEMHVDGFRFDLASALAREFHDVDRLSAFFDVIHQDPVISQVKLIAEPCDLGEGGYQVGNFPPGWAEWNGKYRDAIRRYWKGDERQMADLVSYDGKHNKANGEDNRDGTDDNASWNCGAEGPTDDPAIQTLRERQIRNFLATLLLSQGIPMLLAGDETGRTQHGNNNAYCQDNELSWQNWPLPRTALPQLEFTRQLIRLRLDNPVFHRRLFFQGRRIHGSAVKDLSWFRPDGKEMMEDEWSNGFTRCLGLRLAGDAIEEMDEKGQPIVGDTFLLLLNAHHESIPFVLPAHQARVRWELVVDTRHWGLLPRRPIFRAGESYPLESRSLAVLRLRRPGVRS